MARIIKLILSLGVYAAWRFWGWFLQILGKTPPGAFVVLYYHGVSAHERCSFAQQMDDFIRLAKPVAADFKSPLVDGIHYGAITFDDGFQSVTENALPELVYRNIPATIFVPTAYLGKKAEWMSDPERRDRSGLILTADQLRIIPSTLVSIGSHTVTHPKLPLLTEEDATRELCQSRKELQLIVGRDISLLSFPYGAYNHKILELARQAGYTRVFCIPPGFYNPREYLAPRVIVNPTDWRIEFRLKLLGAYSWLRHVSTAKRKLKQRISQIRQATVLNHNWGLSRRMRTMRQNDTK